MAHNGDADYVEALDIDQEMRARHQSSKSQPKAPIYTPQQAGTSGARSQASDSEDEDAPLLSPTERVHGIADDSDSERSEYEWPGEADFKGLSWWNRPSVSTAIQPFYTLQLTMIDILAPPAILPVHHGVRWHHHPQD
jgi:hypothetical protein